MNQTQEQISSEEIDKKVQTIIQAFNKLQDEYLKKSYDLLSEIYRLRKIQKPDYTIEDLENEKGLERHKDKIRPLMKFSRMSGEVSRLQDEGRLTNSQVFLLVNLPGEMQDEASQKRLAELLIQGKIKEEDLYSSRNYWLLKLFHSPNKMHYETKVVLSAVYGFKHIADLLRDNSEILTQPKYKKKMEENFTLFKKTYRRVMKSK